MKREHLRKRALSRYEKKNMDEYYEDIFGNDQSLLSRTPSPSPERERFGKLFSNFSSLLA